MWYFVTAFAAFGLGMLIACLCGAAGHADHQTDIQSAYQAGFIAGQKKGIWEL